MTEIDSNPPAPVEHIPTADGATVAVKRKPRPGGTPVIFIHGLAVNADLWDLPEIQGPDYHYRSLATLLHEAGYDIWLVNLRGHGAPHMLSAPAPGQADWCVDHFILYDLPPVVDRVIADTGRRPFIIGASMGALPLGGYVQGARLVSDEGGASHIIADPDLAHARQSQLSGCVFAEFPATLRWPDSLYDSDGRLDWGSLIRDYRRHDGDVNHPFELLSRWGWLHALVGAIGEVPLGWLGGAGRGMEWYRKLPKPIGDALEKLEKAAVHALLQGAGTFTGATHHRAEVMIYGRRHCFDHMKGGVLRQFAKCVCRRAFVSDTGSPDHVYSDHYHLVEAPTLVVQGARDRIANATFTRSAFYDRIVTRDKEFLLDDDIAHGEIEAAPVACERLYPAIVQWVQART